ncbi:hypothetical protein LMG19083_01075 [Ralstonia psammae]|uniref:DUF4238 domain-containing protein n=1 Tax=Ralstonia psammae TaxID=3058598 RepID=A0ABN9IM97_9RALS|nr:DUF4238 domain-containing protein [Ralstonia sp. LMG 19083]CAJ0783706.1 hypothetical protein LMG19083_01075 [Ralstonia sp. LMG 19083]
MKQFHRDNHYVPQVYLKQWSSSGQIFVYRLLVPHENVSQWKAHSLRGIAFHQHLYTYMDGKVETDEFERWLSREFEEPAEEAIRRAVNDERMSSDHWRTLVRFAVAQDVRTPASLSAFLNRQRQSLQAVMDASLETSVRTLKAAARAGTALPKQSLERSSLFPVDVSITRDPDGAGTIKTTAVVGRKLWLWGVRHHLTSTIDRISYDDWTILRAPEGITWPTSDKPVMKLRLHSSTSYDFDGGWGVRPCDVFLPLSPKHLLHKSIGRRRVRRGAVLDIQLATFIRKLIVEHAHRYVFDTFKSDIPLIRPRLVSLENVKHEQEAWKNWHREQSEVESNSRQNRADSGPSETQWGG